MTSFSVRTEKADLLILPAIRRHDSYRASQLPFW
nr:MAG TPA: hypothetical protein [Caudoviricetes sp.]